MPEKAKPLLTRRPPPDAQTVQSWQAQMRQAVFEALDQDAIRDVVGAMVEKAKKGDIQAARLLLTYAVGSPTVHVKNAVIMPSHDAEGYPTAPLPAPPSKAPPGSSLRMVDMAARAERGAPLVDPRDAGFGEVD